MSALCCAAPGMATANGNGAPSQQSVYYPFARSYLELNPYAAAAAAAAAAMETASRQSASTVYHHHLQQQQQQQLQQQQQHQQQHVSSARRRKRLEHALAETIPAVSSGKLSQRIAQLQHSLQTVHPLLPASSAPRPLSLDSSKDYSQPLSVDCSIEYDLPRVARPPPGAQPLLLIAPRPRQEVTVRAPSMQQQQRIPSQAFQSPSFMASYTAPVSSCSSDSGRGTDSERGSSPAFGQTFGYGVGAAAWMQQSQQHQQQQPAAMQSWMPAAPSAARHIKVNYHKSTLPVHPRPAEAVRSSQQRTAEISGCPCCPARSAMTTTTTSVATNVQRWAPYSTARQACPAPAPAAYQPTAAVQQWARWNAGQHDQSMTYLNNTSLMAFHV